MRKRIPQSQKLLDEIQGEYARIEAAFLADAAVRIHGEDQHSDLYSIQGSDEYDEGRSRYGSSIDTSML